MHLHNPLNNTISSLSLSLSLLNLHQSVLRPNIFLKLPFIIAVVVVDTALTVGYIFVATQPYFTVTDRILFVEGAAGHRIHFVLIILGLVAGVDGDCDGLVGSVHFVDLYRCQYSLFPVYGDFFGIAYELPIF